MSQCERPECEAEGRIYYQMGRTVSTSGFNYSSAGTIQPSGPITLCREHALEAFGVAF